MCCVAIVNCYGQRANNFTVTAYYFGGLEKVDSLAVEKLTHIIFSFCHLTGNKLTVDDEKDSQSIKKLVEAKKRNKSLKVLLSLGGWERECSSGNTVGTPDTTADRG